MGGPSPLLGIFEQFYIKEEVWISTRALQKLPLLAGCLEDESKCELNIFIQLWCVSVSSRGKQGFEFLLYIEQLISPVHVSLGNTNNNNHSYK